MCAYVFYAYLYNLCASLHIHWAIFILCDIPKCAYKYVDGNIDNVCVQLESFQFLSELSELK